MRFHDSDAVRLAGEIYGLDVSAQELPSERDQNFLLTAGDDSFVLKIAKADEPRELIDLQNQALAWLENQAPHLPFPRVHGQPINGAGGHFVRLLTYLPGTVLAAVKPQTPGLLRDLGRFLGHMDSALEGFKHPAAINRDL